MGVGEMEWGEKISSKCLVGEMGLPCKLIQENDLKLRSPNFIRISGMAISLDMYKERDVD